MSDFTFAHHDYEVSLARRRAAALEALVLLMKLNRDDEMFWHLSEEQRRRIAERFDEEAMGRLLARLNDEYERG